MQIEEPQNLKSGVAQEKDVQLEKPQDFRKRGQGKKEPQRIQEQEKVEAIPTLEEKVSNIQHPEIQPQTKLGGEEPIEQPIKMEQLPEY